jgi:hypothetical protein
MNNQSDDERGTAVRRDRKTLWKVLGLSALSGVGGGTPILKHPDERVAATSQRWAAIGGTFMAVALGIDMMVRILVLKQDFRLCWDICLIWTVNLYLVSIGQIRNGVRPVGAGGKWSWKTSGLITLELALLIPAVLWLMGNIHSLREYLFVALTAAAGCLVMQMILRGIYRRWERRNLGPEAGEGDGDAE